MCMTVRVHVCGWVAFSIPERGIPSVDEKRGMLERSDKPWGANGGVRMSLRVHVRICTSPHPSVRMHPSHLLWHALVGGGAQRQEPVHWRRSPARHKPGTFIGASVSLRSLSISSLCVSLLFHRDRLYHQDLRPLPATTPTLLAIFGRSRLHRCFRPSRSYAAHRRPCSSSGGGSG